MTQQRCGACKESKDQEDFSPSYRGKPGTWCKDCAAANARGDLVRSEHAPRRCQECQTEYVPKRVRSEVRLFCSQRCASKSSDRQDSKERLAAKALLARTCGHCGEAIAASVRADAQYCSNDCTVKARIERKRQLRLTARSTVQCHWCSSTLVHRTGRAVTCGAAECKRRGSRDVRIRRVYGIDSVTFDRLFEDQGKACAICLRTDESSSVTWSIDHCHASGAVRGILCTRCNTGIGQMGDDPARLRAAADYIEQAR